MGIAMGIVVLVPTRLLVITKVLVPTKVLAAIRDRAVRTIQSAFLTGASRAERLTRTATVRDHVSHCQELILHSEIVDVRPADLNPHLITTPHRVTVCRRSIGLSRCRRDNCKPPQVFCARCQSQDRCVSRTCCHLVAATPFWRRSSHSMKRFSASGNRVVP
jgi:hypothetical protein